MTQLEIIFNIKNLIGGGLQSDDFDLSDRQLAFIVDYYRAKIIKQDIDRGVFNSSRYAQNLIIPIDPECKAFKVPTTITMLGGSEFTYVGTKTTPFQYAEFNALKWLRSAKYTGNDPKYYVEDGYIKLENPTSKMINRIYTSAVYENPFEAVSCSETSCDLYDFKYPMPLAKVDLIVKLIAETELSVLRAIPKDTLNDGQDQLEGVQS